MGQGLHFFLVGGYLLFYNTFGVCAFELSNVIFLSLYNLSVFDSVAIYFLLTYFKTFLL